MKKATILFFILTLFVFPAKRLEFNDFIKISQIGNLTVSPDGSRLVFTVSTPCMKKNRNLSFIYMKDLKTGEVSKLTTSGKDYIPRFSPQGELAFLSSRDGKAKIYVFPKNGGEPRVLLEFVTDITDFRFSDDGKYIVFTADVLPNYKNFDDLKKKLEEKSRNKWFHTDKLFYRVWNTWREGLYSHVFLATKDGKVLKDIMKGMPKDSPPLDLGSSHDFILAQGKIFFVMNSDPEPALSTNNDIYAYDIKSGKMKKLTTGRGNDAAPFVCPCGKHLVWLSMKRPGYESDQTEITRMDLKSGKIDVLTLFLDRHIIDFVHGKDKLYFTAYDEGYHPIYSVDEKGKIEKALDKVYARNLVYSKEHLYFTNEAVNRPQEIYSLDLKTGKIERLTDINMSKLKDVEMNPLESFWFKGAKGDKVQGFIVKPPFFDPKKKYPTIMLIHGGPQGMWSDDFHPRWNVSMFASPGYVIVMVNFHGSKGYGIKFTDSINKDWGGKPYIDIIKGMKEAIKRYPFIDRNRIGAAGASYGGYMIDWIEGHNPGIFKVLVSHAGVYDLPSMYGATEELWFPRWEYGGAPWEVGKVYKKLSPSSYVKNFRTPCLVIAGEHDYRVPYTQSLQFFTALQEMGVESELLFFHDEYHFVVKPKNRKVWWERVIGWFDRHLK
ncbi:MAG: S9 family peptidase [Candidatus Aminicenantes bacterium]|nr:S9 family peptidase [Candidatus Aminicenantes bacterium]